MNIVGVDKVSVSFLWMMMMMMMMMIVVYLISDETFLCLFPYKEVITAAALRCEQ